MSIQVETSRGEEPASTIQIVITGRVAPLRPSTERTMS